MNGWYGVFCDETGFWAQGQIGGVLPSSIGKLKNTKQLSLGEQKFEGAIPASVGNMTKLTEFYGHSNRFESVPEFTYCNELMLVSISEIIDEGVESGAIIVHGGEDVGEGGNWRSSRSEA